MERNFSGSGLNQTPKCGSKNKTDDYICCVCGDKATNYRFYGASSVCYSCRIFFRRVVTAKQEFKCHASGPKKKMCSFDRFTRNQCKKCRFDKCLSVGLLPYLVNTANRKNIKAQQKMKSSNSEQEVQVLRSESENSTSTLKILFNSGVNQNENVRLRPEDLFENGLILLKVGRVMEDIFFNQNMDENLALYCKLVESMDESCIQQLRHKEKSITMPSNAMDISSKVLFYFTRTFLSIFFPHTDDMILQEISENVILNIIGLGVAMDGCYQYDNLLEQWEKDFFLINSEKMRNYYRCTYPDVDALEPIHLEMFDMAKSPYAKSKNDEDFVDSTRQKLRDLLKSDEHLGRLVYLLALFSPVKLQIPEKENRLLLDYQQKISIMIYSHLMGRVGANNVASLNRMANVVSMMEDFKKVGKIFQSGLINCSQDAAVELDCIEIESLA